MRRPFFIFLIIIVGQFASGQKLRVLFSPGFGTYQMTDLKEFQTELAGLINGLPVEAVQAFPGYFNYSASLEFLLKNNSVIGIEGLFYTSGGRNHLKDYSGEYRFDMLINGFGIAAHYKDYFLTLNKYRFYLGAKFGAVFSDLKLVQFINIYKVGPTETSDRFKSASPFVEPCAGILYDLQSNFALDFQLGYQADLKTKLHTAANSKYILSKPSGGMAYADWSGVRISLGITYSIF